MMISSTIHSRVPGLLVHTAFLAACCMVISCREPAGPEETPITGDWKLQVKLSAVDEFFLPTPITGQTTLTLTADNHTLHAAVPGSDTMYVFENIPYQTYMITADHPGYYSSQRLVNWQNYRLLETALVLYPLPPPQMKIDSIQCIVKTDIPQLWLKLSTERALPKGGQRSAVAFFGVNNTVSPVFGTYVFTLDWLTQTAGNSEIVSDEFYRELHACGVASGVRVYVTVRLCTGVTTNQRDVATGVMRYGNLETNTTTVSSFIMP